jgi:hypothetical protein
VPARAIHRDYGVYARHDALADLGYATLGLYDKVGTVFTAGTVNWAVGLRPEAAGGPVEIITRKLLRRLGSSM